MPKQTKVCRVCGKPYEACNSIKTGSPIFNWREVACSPECGETYFRQVMEARNMAPVAEPNEYHNAQKKKKSRPQDAEPISREADDKAVVARDDLVCVLEEHE